MNALHLFKTGFAIVFRKSLFWKGVRANTFIAVTEDIENNLSDSLNLSLFKAPLRLDK
jgi:hypothetical protein